MGDLTAGGAQLALLRLLEQAGSGGVDDGLARLVLATPATGRGRVDPAGGAGDVPVAEVQRVAIGVLARLVDDHLAAAPPGHEASPEPRAGRYWARRFRVHGSPLAAGAARAALRQAGLVEGSYRTTHVVLALPLELMVREHWADAIARGGGRRWRRLWRLLERQDRVPARLDPIAVADRLVAAGKRVEVVVAPSWSDAVVAAGGALGVRAVPAAPGDPDPVATDVRRRLNVVRAAPAPDGLVEAWCGRRPGAPLAAPTESRAWLADRAERLAGRLTDRSRAGHYPVHGDPAELARLLGGEVRRGIGPAEALAATVAGIRAARQEVD